MKRSVLAFAVAIGLAIGTAIPASALGLTEATLTCDDGTTNTLVVDPDTLLGLTQAVQAMIDYPAGLTCTLAQIPLLSAFGAVALAANDEPFVVGGGRYQLPCSSNGLPGAGFGAPTKDETMYWINIAVNAHQKDGAYVGTLNETIPEGQCKDHGHFTSKPTCLFIDPSDPSGKTALVTSKVTQTSHSTLNNFFVGEVMEGDFVRFSFKDNGNPSQGVDFLNGDLSTNPLGDLTCPSTNFTDIPSVPLLNGNITVHPR